VGVDRFERGGGELQYAAELLTQVPVERLATLGPVGREQGHERVGGRARGRGAWLEAAIELERAQGVAEESEDEDERDPNRTTSVSLAQRAWPLIDMLRTAAAAEREITWGV
jgi:hypothetical protein